MNVGNVFEQECVFSRPNRQVGKVFNGLKLPLHPRPHFLFIQAQNTLRGHGILAVDLIEDVLRRNTQLRDFVMRDVDKHFLGLNAK